MDAKVREGLRLVDLTGMKKHVEHAIQGVTDPKERLSKAWTVVDNWVMNAWDYVTPETRAVSQYLKDLLNKNPGEALKELMATIETVYKEDQEPRLKYAGNNHSEGGVSMLKNAQQYTERLDKIATEIQTASPEMAYYVDMVSDVIDGRRSASTLKFDPDEAKYMAGRFNFQVRKRDADEPYMDGYNQNDFEQVMGVRKNPVPVKVAYAKVPADQQ